MSDTNRRGDTLPRVDSWVWYRGSRGQVVSARNATVQLTNWRGMADTLAPLSACTPAPDPLPQDRDYPPPPHR